MTTSPKTVTKEQLIEELSAVVADTEKLLKSLAGAGGEKIETLRGSVEQSLARARERLGELHQSAMDKSDAAIEVADDYVRENPWHAVGIAVGVGAILGLVLGLSMSRR